MHYFVLAVFHASLFNASTPSDLYSRTVEQDRPAVYLRFEALDRADEKSTKDQGTIETTRYHGQITLNAGVPGIGGSAASFNGKDAYAEIDSKAIPIGDVVSVEFWMKSKQPFDQPYWPGSASLVSRGTAGAGSGDWTIIGGSNRSAENNGQLIVGVGPLGKEDTLLASSSRMNDGEWHHIVWTRSFFGENRLYLDGILTMSVRDHGGKIQSERSIQIGGDPFLGGPFFEGSLDELAIYSHVLSADRVVAHAQAGGLEPKQRFGSSKHSTPLVLKIDKLRNYVDQFNAHDRETTSSFVPNAESFDWLEANIPLFDCPDVDIERAYYFRWWTYRKHIQQTLEGFVVTEFTPPVSWAGKHNTISCAAGHHIYEGRWLSNPQYLNDYSSFWFYKGGEPRRYSCWIADAIYARYLATGDRGFAVPLLAELIKNYEGWEREHLDPNGLYWQVDDRDGMISIGGSGYRGTINSYQFGDANAIAEIASLAGRYDIANQYRQKAAKIKHLVQEKLWDSKAQFFGVPRGEGKELSDVRELHGYVPWYFNLPDADRSVAWSQLTDRQGFWGDFGPATAERRHPRFRFPNEHECLWNGPSWPYATSQTLVALANLFNNYQQTAIDRQAYFRLLELCSFTSTHNFSRSGC